MNIEENLELNFCFYALHFMPMLIKRLHHITMQKYKAGFEIIFINNEYLIKFNCKFVNIKFIDACNTFKLNKHLKFFKIFIAFFL